MNVQGSIETRSVYFYLHVYLRAHYRHPTLSSSRLLTLSYQLYEFYRLCKQSSEVYSEVVIAASIFCVIHSYLPYLPSPSSSSPPPQLPVSALSDEQPTIAAYTVDIAAWDSETQSDSSQGNDVSLFKELQLCISSPNPYLVSLPVRHHLLCQQFQQMPAWNDRIETDDGTGKSAENLNSPLSLPVSFAASSLVWPPILSSLTHLHLSDTLPCIHDILSVLRMPICYNTQMRIFKMDGAFWPSWHHFFSAITPLLSSPSLSLPISPLTILSSTSTHTTVPKTLIRPAKARWAILKQALSKTSAASSSSSSISIHRHTGIHVLSKRDLSAADIVQLGFVAEEQRKKEEEKYCYVAYSMHEYPSSPIYLRIRLNTSVDVHELSPAAAVDNTGNICIWNSEELLGYVACKAVLGNAPLIPSSCLSFTLSLSSSSSSSSTSTSPISPIRIIELGAGQSGLAALMVAQALRRTGRAYDICITDGNDRCASELHTQLSLNASQLVDNSSMQYNVQTKCMIWNSQDKYEEMGRYDWIIAADCLFFQDYHVDLLHVLSTLLSLNGIIWLLAPGRGKTAEKFMGLVEKSGEWKVEWWGEKYDEEIWKQHQQYLKDNCHAGNNNNNIALYDPDLHYPQLIVLRRHAS